MKVVVVLLGAHGSGKSTLSGQLLVHPKEYFTNVNGETVRVTFSSGGMALAGNLKNGSDSIKRMSTLRCLVEHLLNYCDTVIVDGFRCAHVFTVFVQTLPIADLGVVFVHLALPLELNIRRLLERRRAAGVTEDLLPARTKTNLLRARKRAWAVFDRARHTYNRQPVDFVTLRERLTPQEEAVRVWKGIQGLRSLPPRQQRMQLSPG